MIGRHRLLLVLSSDAVEGITQTEVICCLSMYTLNQLRKKGYTNVQVITLPLQEGKNLENYRNWLSGLSDKLCASYTGILNRYHQVNFSQEAWRYMIGLWCYYFLCISLDRYYRLLEVERCYPDISIVGVDLPWHQEFFPNTVADLLNLSKDENYNAFIWTVLAKQLNLNVIRTVSTSLGVALKETRMTRKNRHFKKRCYNSMLLLLYKTMLRRAKVILIDAYFPKVFSLKLLIFSLGRILISPEFALPNVEANKDRPVLIVPQLTGDGAIDKFLEKMMPLMFPKMLFEGFNAYEKVVKPLYSSVNQVIFTANGWQKETSHFGLMAAYFHDEEKQVWGAPHGGGGSLLREHYCYTHHEILLANRYFSSGSLAENYYEHAQKMPLPIGCGSRKTQNSWKRKQPKNQFLYGLTAFPPYTSNFDFYTDSYLDYMAFVKRFFSAIDQELEAELLVRTHCEEYWWDLNNYIKSVNGRIKFDSWNQSFYRSLSCANLYICDHISTTYAQALMLDKPIVLFFDVKQARVTKAALPFLMALKRVGIFHETPESAVDHLKKIRDNIADWWFSKELQLVKAEFIDNFTYASPRSFKAWLRALSG